MIKYINPEELIHRKEFVHEPVNRLSESLKEKFAKKIVLYGGRGVGKSTVLYNHQNRVANTIDPAIYTCFDSSGLLEYSDSHRVVTAYYELIMADKILNYIENYYERVYGKNWFVSEREKVSKLLGETNECINSDRNVSNIKHVRFGEFTDNIVDKFKNVTNISSLTLMIDRFDWADTDSKLIQDVLKKYFCFFDRTIITTDDEEMLDLKSAKVRDMKDSGYCFFRINYGIDIIIINRIWKLRVIEINNGLPINQRFPIDSLPDKTLARLSAVSKGNMNIIISILNEIYSNWKPEYEEKDYDFISEIDMHSEKKFEEMRKMKRYSNPIKIYYK